MSEGAAGAAGGIPGIIAHRGFAARYPENTLRALEEALALGVYGVEFDVQFTADGHPVLLHDLSLRRTGGHPGMVTALTRSQVLSMSAGEPERFGRRFAQVRIPALEDAAALLTRWPDAVAFVEVKGESLASLGTARAVARVLAALDGVLSRCVVISYDAAVLAAASARGAPRIGLVLDRCGDAERDAARTLVPDFIFCEVGAVPPEPWAGGWQWAVFEVTDPEQALSLGRRGVAFVETMAPDRLLSHPGLASRPPRGR